MAVHKWKLVWIVNHKIKCYFLVKNCRDGNKIRCYIWKKHTADRSCIPCLNSKLFERVAYEMKNQQMSLFKFYSCFDGSLHVSGLQAHLQKNSHSCSHNHWFSACTVRAACTLRERYRHWTNGCMNSCVNSPEDGPVGPKRVEIRRNMNKIEIVTSAGFSFHMLKGGMVQKA
jgi:hypothetical protein